MYSLNAAEALLRWSFLAQSFTEKSRRGTFGRTHFYEKLAHGSTHRLVFVHGIGSNALSMLPLAEACHRHGFSVNAIDLLGHGRSATPQRLDLERAFVALRQCVQTLPGRIVLVGNSLGGALSLQYAAMFPHALSALVLLSPAGAPFAPGEFEHLRALFSVPGHDAMLDFLGRIYERPPRHIKLLAGDIRQRLRARAVTELFASVDENSTFDAELVSGLRCPVMMLWGTADRLLPRSGFEFYRRHLPAHAVIEQPVGYSHCPHLEHPRAVAQRLLEFVRKHAAPSLRR